MIVVGFRPIMVTDAGFFKALKANVSDGFVLLVKAHPIETFEGDKIHELNRRPDLGAIREKLADLYTELEDLDPDSCADAVAWVRSEIDRLHYDLTHGSFVTVKPLKEGDYESNQN